MEKSELRRLVFEVLRYEPQTHLNSVEYQVRRSAADGYERPDALKVQEIIWELLVQGVLAPGKNSLNLNLPFFHVTAYGEECLESGAILLHNPQGYVNHLCKMVPALDRTILTYVQEGERAFLAGAYFGCVALLGMAAERCLDLVIQASSRDNDAGSSGWTDSRVRELNKHLLLFPEEQRAEIELHLDELRGLIRRSRNQDGHVVCHPMKRATAQACLLLFPAACQGAYRLITELSPRN